MALLDFLQGPAILDRLDSLNLNLRRIADAADRMCPPINEDKLEERRKRGPAAIIRYGKEDQGWAREQLKDLIDEAGLPPEKAQELLAEAMTKWQSEEYGED